MFISQGPCIYHVWVLRSFPLVYRSSRFWFYGHPGKRLSWWPDIFTRLWALQRALSVMGWDVQNWVLEPPKSPSKDTATGFLPFLFIFCLIPEWAPNRRENAVGLIMWESLNMTTVIPSTCLLLCMFQITFIPIIIWNGFKIPAW